MIACHDKILNGYLSGIGISNENAKTLNTPSATTQNKIIYIRLRYNPKRYCCENQGCKVLHWVG